MSRLKLEVRINGSVSKNGLFHLLMNGVFWGYNPLILTFDPNFLGHPSTIPIERRDNDGSKFLAALGDYPEKVS